MFLLKSIFNPQPVRDETQHLTPTSPISTLSNPSTVYRGRVTHLSGESQFVGDEEIKTWKLLLGYQEQNMFLKRACSSGLILKSFARKRVPANLCFTWQEEALKEQIAEENTLKTSFNKHKWNQLTPEKRSFLRKWKSVKKKHLIKKFRKLTNHHHDWQKVKPVAGSKFKKRLDRTRYKTSKSKKSLAAAKLKILNFSSFQISDTLYSILGKGFNFIPTPTPTRLKHAEHVNSMQHLRRNEWRCAFSEKERREFEKLPEKLKQFKSNRPQEPTYTLTEETKAYSNTIMAGMRVFDSWAKLKKQNLQKEERKALREFQSACNTSIMICSSDKDQKLVILNMDDYKKQVQTEIDKNYVSKKLPSIIETAAIKEDCREYCKTLHVHDVISTACLEGAVGLKYKESSDTYRPVVHSASQFKYDFEEGYAHVYPLFKTHKIKPGCEYSSIYEIPIRLVTAGNRIPTTRVMSMLEHVLQEPMKRYCGSEYTKDSTDYLKCLTDQNIYADKNLSIICLDVVALYPNASRDLTYKAVRECLDGENWNPVAVNAYMELVKLCMTEIYIKFDGKTFTADSGIITGAPNSVSLANCMVRYITRRIDTSICRIWKRFIDDIVLFIETRDQRTIDLFVTGISIEFEKFGLEITSRYLNPESLQQDKNGTAITTIEFLDIDHSFDDSDHVQTGLFVKKTASNSTFLHPSSYHPQHIPIGTLKGEMTRIRKLASNELMFQAGVEVVLEKARRSGFSNKVLNEIQELIVSWDNEKRDSLLAQTPRTSSVETALVWVTQLPTCIKNQFSDLKKYLPKNISLRIAYQKPASIRTLCSRPRSLEQVDGESAPCGKCKLCGNFGKPRGQNMIPTVSSLKIKNKNYKINSKLDCTSSGIYVAICSTCEETYVGQTSTAFKTRFNGHRHKWVNATESQNRDDTALLDHYREFHKNIYDKWCTDYPTSNKEQSGFDRAFRIVFVDKVGANLSQQEDFWKQKLQSSINRCNILLPSITY